MPLQPRTRLGPYEVVAMLGAGGMGEVYRARDVRLGREVAIKVLPAGTGGAEARSRFEREARAIATLKHPHICVLYDLGHESGVDFLVMESLEGETLAGRLNRARLSPKEALTLGVEIAGALEAAHRAGIVHRDLKPGNIMLTPAGAKLLDFGLARDTAVAGVPDDRSQSPTRTQPLTAEGAIVGTFQYMSPEQLEGHDADARSDVYAFGATLYEALSGRRAFEGRSPASLIAAIMKDDPPSLMALQPLTPPALDRVVRVCLAKDPGERWQSAGDLRRELEWISSETGPATAAHARPVAAPGGRRGFWLRTGSLVAAVLAVMAAAWALLPRGPRLNPDMRTRIVNVPMSGIDYPGLSQDGKWIAFPARDERGVWGLYFMNARGGDVRAIAIDSTFQPFYADISPDGSQIAYSGTILQGPHAFQDEVRLVPALGGPVRTLARPGRAPHWRPDGARIGYRLGGNEFRSVRPDGSDNALEFADSGNVTARSSSAWSPDGKEVAWLRSFEHAAFNEIIIRNLRTGRERQLTRDHKAIDEVAWTRQNEIVFSSNRGGATNLWMVSASGGKPVQLTRGPGPDLGLRVSADGGTLLYLIKQPLVRLSWWNVETGERGPITHQERPFSRASPSPDGSRLLVSVQDPDVVSEAFSVAILNRDGSGERVLIPAERDPRGYTWSPDGRRVIWGTVTPESTHSAVLRLLDVDTGEESAPIQVPTRDAFNGVRWSQGDTLILSDARGNARFSLSEGRVFDRGPDSVFIINVNTPGWKVFNDLTAIPRGIYASPVGGGPARFVCPPVGNSRWSGVPDRSFAYCWPNSLGFSRIFFPSGRFEPVPHVPPDIRGGTAFAANRDGRVIVWMEPHDAAKLVLVENLHR